MTRVRVDIDHRGKLDAFSVCNTEEPDRVRGVSVTHAYARLETTGWGRVDRPLSGLWLRPTIIGVTDLDGDRTPEIWLDVGGNTRHYVGLVSFSEGEPFEVFYKRDAAELLFAATGNSSFGVTVGVECTNVDLDGVREIVVTEQQEALSEKSYGQNVPESWTYTAYRLEGIDLDRVAVERGTSLASKPSGLRWEGGLNCQNLKYNLGDEPPDVERSPV